MYLQRYYLNCLAHASYLIADEETGTAVVIDPQRDVDQYLADAADRGYEIKYVFLTHFHADFVAGHIELHKKTGAKIYLGARAEAEYDFVPIREGDVIEFGRVRLSVLETPGHTPESISILLFDLDRSDMEPFAVFTGDTLFVGDVGRPDLLASVGVTADELASMLYDSLHKLLQLPDDVRVYPAHGAGSLCGKQLGNDAFTTIGDQRKYNYALQPMSREEFTRLVTADQPEAPAYFLHDAMLNRQERRSLDDVLKETMVPLELEEVLELQRNGAQVVDTRDPVEFAGAHLAGAINIGLDGRYAHWCGALLDKERPIVVIAEHGREEEAVMRLGRIGFDRVEGYLRNGVEVLEHHPDHIAVVNRITAAALAERLERCEPTVVVDVRTEPEWRAGHLAGAIHIPLPHLAERLDEIQPQGMVVVHCESGYRSSIAASIMQRHGIDSPFDLVGGFRAWRMSHLPVVEDETASTA